jgi:hypothetical protein
MIVCTYDYSRRYAITGSIAAPRPNGLKGGSVRFPPIEVGYTHPYRRQLTPPLVYCSFPLAALNMEPEIDRFLGAVDPIGAEPEFSGGLGVHAKTRS